MTTSRPRAVLLDLDGTLLDYDDTIWAATVRYTCAQVAVTAPGIDVDLLFAAYQRICSVHWATAATAVIRSPSGALSGHVIWRENWHEALAECGHPEPALAELAVAHYRDDRLRRYRLYGDVSRFLTALRAHVSVLALITNGPGDTQREKLRATGLSHCFDAIGISGEMGVSKPDAQIFRAVLDECDVRPRDAWHIGDSVISDIAGAANAGLGAGIWLNRTGAVTVARKDFTSIPIHEVHSLTEVTNLMLRG